MTQDVMLQEAIQAVQQGHQARARDLLTRLLRVDPSNPEYWMWMSAVVDSPHERTYCLQSVLRVDPGHPAARRGLVLAGALPPDADHQPVPPRRRNWEAALGQEPPRRGLQALRSNPLLRAVLFVTTMLVVTGLILAGVFGLGRRRAAVALLPTQTPGPPATFTPTPTFIGGSRPAAATPEPTRAGPLPLWMSLDATYTPTPVYVNTPHAISEAYRSGQLAAAQGNWPKALDYYRQAAQVDPSAADIPYHMGEALQRLGEYEQALAAYEQALSLNENFSPAYLGRAQARLALGAKTSADLAQVEEDLLQAVSLDPGFGEVFLAQAAYSLSVQEPDAALESLQAAESLLPESPLLFLYRAQAALMLGDVQSALEDARRAVEMDSTLLQAYRTLGEAALLAKQDRTATEGLKTYLLYMAEDAIAWQMLGQAYSGLAQPVEVLHRWPLPGRDYRAALEAFDRALALDPQLPDLFLQRGLVQVALKEGQEAVNELLEARKAGSGTFAVNYALGRALLLAGRAEDALAYLRNSQALAESDGQLAAVFYWRAQAWEALSRDPAAIQDWQALLALPEEARPGAWAAAAEAHISILATPTATATATATAAPTKTIRVTLTRTATPQATRTARARLTSTPAPLGKASPTPVSRTTQLP